ncbi:MAG: peptidase M48 [Chlorobiaceae bacterium]|nr:peptidase M48 [Chlorobiaceae bacterium]MBA4309250.1 peptidase M48 [Chlorobiaceae bacterium]
MNKIKHTSLVILVFISSFTIFSCDEGINIFTVQDDVALGLQVEQEIYNNTQEYPIFRGDPAIKNYINNNILQAILASPKIERANVFQYSVEIIARDDVLNAFVLPGGRMFVYTGLLKYLDSEAALAGILAHEVAHAEERHATERMTKQYGISILIGIILGDKPSQLAEIAANLFAGLTLLANSRADEDQSDLRSFEYLQDTKYYPGSVKFFFEKMRDEGIVNSNPAKIETFLSTHPNPIERIAVTNQRLQQAGIAVKDWRSNDAGIFRNDYLTNIRNRLP